MVNWALQRENVHESVLKIAVDCCFLFVSCSFEVVEALFGCKDSTEFPAFSPEECLNDFGHAVYRKNKGVQSKA